MTLLQLCCNRNMDFTHRLESHVILKHVTRLQHKT